MSCIYVSFRKLVMTSSFSLFFFHSIIFFHVLLLLSSSFFYNLYLSFVFTLCQLYCLSPYSVLLLSFFFLFNFSCNLFCFILKQSTTTSLCFQSFFPSSLLSLDQLKEKKLCFFCDKKISQLEFSTNKNNFLGIIFFVFIFSLFNHFIWFHSVYKTDFYCISSILLLLN